MDWSSSCVGWLISDVAMAMPNPSVGLCYSVDIFVFRFALVISDLVTWGFWFSDLQCVLGFVLFFFFLRIHGFALPIYHLLDFFFFFSCLDWVCFMFRIDVGLFFGYALLQFFFFFLKVEQINFFCIFCLRVFLNFFFEGVHNFFKRVNK